MQSWHQSHRNPLVGYVLDVLYCVVLSCVVSNARREEGMALDIAYNCADPASGRALVHALTNSIIIFPFRVHVLAWCYQLLAPVDLAVPAVVV